MELREMVELNDTELDAVAAGALIFVPVTVVATDVVDVRDTNIGVAAQALTANSEQTFRQRT